MPAAEPLPSSIEHVTVHRLGAVVSRRAHVATGGAWPAELAFGPLPLALDDASVRVALAPGTAVELADVRVELVLPPLGAPLESAADAEIRVARRALERLYERRAALDRELAELASLKLTLAPARIKRAPRPVALGAWRALEDWTRAARRARIEDRVALERDIELADEHVRALLQAHAAARARKDASSDVVTKVVRFTLRGEGSPPSELALTFEYTVPGARWVPTYVMRIARDGRSAELAVRALVAQASGEPWERVRLSLSTAELVREVALPELASLRIGRRQEGARASGWRAPPEGAGALFQALDQALAALPSPAAPRPLELDVIVKEAAALDATAPPPPRPPKAKAAPPKPVAPPPPPPMPTAELAMPVGAVMAPSPPMMAPAPMSAPMAAAMPPGAPQMQSMPKRSRARAAAAPEQAATRAGGGFFARNEAPLDVARDEAEAYGDDGGALGADLLADEAGPLRPALEALRYGARVMRPWNDPQRGRLEPEPAPSSDEVRRALGVALAVAGAALPAGTWVVGAHDGFDHRYDADAPADVLGDGRWHAVALTSRSAPIRSTLVVVPRESTEAVRVATLANPLRAPLLPGPADVYWGDELLVTAPVRAVPPGGELTLGLGVDERLKVARNAHFEEETKGLLSATTHLRHEVVIDLASRLGEAVRVEVRERLPLKDEGEREDLDVVVGRVEPAWEDYDQAEVTGAPMKGGKRWRFELAAGREQRLVYEYVVKIGGKHELVGGNRRER